ncbi:MAG: hypothetical protein JXA41_08235 [Deltaproteobacteria bacterium]|nr:hypothetical protein [Deltaproteobacteria bacterium]
MNENKDNRLNSLFNKARTIRPQIKDIEAGFEIRVRNRLIREKALGTSLLFWTWRLVPVLTLLLFILLAVNAVVGPSRSPDLYAFLLNGYEQSQVKQYLTGE